MPSGQYVRKPGIGDSNSNVERYIYIGKKKLGRNQEELPSKFTVQRRYMYAFSTSKSPLIRDWTDTDRAGRFNRAVAR